MKKCPTCEKTFEDSMRFCQTDGTPLIDDEPVFDPYATMVSTPKSVLMQDEAKPEPDAPIHLTASSVPISAPDDVLDLPEADPLKTMYASDAEMEAILTESKGEVVDVPPVGDPPAPEPEPPTFTEPDLPSPTFGETTPPPSPFSSPESSFAEAVSAAPVFDEPTPASVPFEEEKTVLEDQFEKSLKTSAADTDWSPPPAPVANWQEQPIGANTPFQPPPAGVSGQNSTMAIISLVAGILGLTICCGTLIPSIVGLVMGFMAKSKATNNPNEYGGSGLALAGIITGAIGVVGGIFVLILVLLPYVFVMLANL